MLYLSFVACLIFVLLPQASTLQSIVHDAQFKPDEVLHVTQEEVPVACTTRLTTVVNGTPQSSCRSQKAPKMITQQH